MDLTMNRNLKDFISELNPFDKVYIGKTCRKAYEWLGCKMYEDTKGCYEIPFESYNFTPYYDMVREYWRITIYG